MMDISEKKRKSMTATERDKKAKRLLGTSVGAYTLAFIYLFVCSVIKAPECIAAWGFVILTVVGAVSACSYGNLPRPWITPECLEELQRMLENMKEEK